MLLHYKRSGLSTEKLKEIYCAMTRSIIEYTSVVYHSHLNVGQSNEQEKIQKRYLRALYGYDLKYDESLSVSGLSTLKDWRIRAFEKCATNTTKNPKYAHWFPQRQLARHTRTNNLYLEEKAVGNRL